MNTTTGRIWAVLLILAALLGGCSTSDNDDVNTLGSDPYVTEGGTAKTFALFEPGTQVMPLPNDVVWLADGDPEVEISGDGDLAQLADWVGQLDLLGLSPNMFLTVPLSAPVREDTLELLVFQTDDPDLGAFLQALAGGDLNAAAAALAGIETRTEADFVAVLDGTTLKLLPETPLIPGAAYAVAVRNSLLDTNGFPVDSSLAMGALKSREPFGPDHPFARLETLRAGFNDPNPSTGAPGLFDIVEAVTGVLFAGDAWSRDDVAVLWTLHTAADTLALPQGENDPPETLGYAQILGESATFRNLSQAGHTDTTVTWLDGTGAPSAGNTPVAIPAQGVLDPEGIPFDALASIYFGAFTSPDLASAGVESTNVTFLLTTPAVAADPMPVVVFQHGIGRSKEDGLALANALGRAGLATLAVDAPFHGARNPDPDTYASGELFFTANLILDRLNIYQAAADLWEAVDRIEAGVDLDAHLPGGDAGADLDATRIGFVAHSLGSIIGSVFLSAETEAEKMVLSSPSAQLANVLDDTAIASLQAILASLGYTPGTTSYYVFLNVVQWLLDPVDAAYNGIGSNGEADLLVVFAEQDPVVSDNSTRTFLSNLTTLGTPTVVDHRDIDPADPTTFPSAAAGAYQYGVDGALVVHSFLLNPSVRDRQTGEVEPIYAGAEYDEASQVNATTGAQAQTATFLATP